MPIDRYGGRGNLRLTGNAFIGIAERYLKGISGVRASRSASRKYVIEGRPINIGGLASAQLGAVASRAPVDAPFPPKQCTVSQDRANKYNVFGEG